ncbi:hypothetical protein MPER_14480 [Moniliophthora perniciosa FA553]|nr:hypothetical protein MPER_14480 [Moniliophthora perniciosa FA553]
MTPPTIGPTLLLFDPEPLEDADADAEGPGAGEVLEAPEDVKVGGSVPVDSAIVVNARRTRPVSWTYNNIRVCVGWYSRPEWDIKGEPE